MDRLDLSFSFLFYPLAVTVSIQQPIYSIPEGNTVQVCAELSQEAETRVVIDLLIEGTSAQLNTDFTLSPATQVLIFEPGIIESCVNVLAISDSLLEEDEGFTLSLESNNQFVMISSSERSATVTIPNENCKNMFDL